MKYSFFISLLSVLLFASCGGQKTTPNGFAYENHTNLGGKVPQVGDQVFYHIHTYHDGQEVRSTRYNGVPASTPLPDLSQGPDTKGGRANPIIDAVSVMGKGDSATVIMPIDEKMKKDPGMANVQELKFAVYVEEVMTAEEFKAHQEAEVAKLDGIAARGRDEIAPLVAELVKNYAEGNLDDKIQVTESGLKYQILEQGTGAQAVPGKSVKIHHYGVLTDGTHFDDSFRKKRPFTFPLGQSRVTKGWDEGIALLKEGGKGFLFVPAELGFGAADKGTIPPNSELIFYIELLGVK